MKIRTRLLILLLSITLIPLLLCMFYYSISTTRLSQQLAADTREQLLENAFTLLHTIVDEYGQIFKRDEAQILLALQLQAREVEHRLAKQPEKTQTLYFSADFDQADSQPAGLILSNKHFRPGPDGELKAIPVSYQQQVIFLAAGVDKTTVTTDLHRLASMSEVYRLVHDIRPELFLWQYTALETGIHISFPGKGGYPADYDPRQREWYQAAKDAKNPVSRVITDLSTRNLILTMSMPVYRPDGGFAGVTAIDVVYRWLLADWKVPEQWQEVAESMILTLHDKTEEVAQRVEIVYRNQQQNRRSNWQLPVEKQYLLSDDPQQMSAVINDLRSGASGVRKVQYQGQEVLWAYGSRDKGFPFPFISLPYENVVQQATRAETFALNQVQSAIKLSALMLFSVVLVVSALAILRSRTISLPIQQLAFAAEKLKDGHFDVRVDIKTGDELQDLGEAFNVMSISLQEREKMKQSLALAREIQQHLLPVSAPHLEGFEILGRSLYCDETGGDYYDYIEIEDVGVNKLGIAVGDISGHGIGAALLMTTARGILRSLANEQKSNLSLLLYNLNRHLIRDTQDDAFMTLFYVVLDSDSRSCNWISAGHGPTFYFSATDRSVTVLPCSGIPLGILEQTQFDKSLPLAMAPGDILLIGTDGIWEAANHEGEMFGTERLISLLKKCSMTSATEICSAIFSEVTAFRAGAIQSDDITMVIIKAV